MTPSPRTMQKLWLAVLVGCVILWVIATVIGLVNSPAFISHISMLALVLTAGAGVVSESVRRNQYEENVPEDVVHKIVEKTDVEEQ